MLFLYPLLLVSILLTATQRLSAQHFEWAASGNNLVTGYSHSCITPQGRLIAAGQYEELYGYPAKGPTEIYSGNGSGFPLFGRSEQFFISSFSKSGEIEWMISGAKYFNRCRMKGITVQKDGTVVVAFTSSGVNQPVIQTDLPPGASEEVTGNTKNYLYFAFIEPKGSISAVYAVAKAPGGEWWNFKATNDGGFLVSHSGEVSVEFNGRKLYVLHNFTTKLDAAFKTQWQHKIMNLDEQCCTIYKCVADINTNGDIYVAGAFRKGARPDGGKDYISPQVNNIKNDFSDFDSYLACLTPQGSLKWIKYTGGRFMINDIKANGQRIVIGGKIHREPQFMGKLLDTTNHKKAFLASFNETGNINWIKTFNAEEITAVSADAAGNIFAGFDSRQSPYKPPLRLGGEADTVPDTYKRVIIGCYDANGQYRWYKKSRAMLSTPSNMQLHNDDCGNLYLTAEMWYVSSVSMRMFDGAIVSGRGYGGAPLAAKVRTTIPEDLLQQNQQLVTPKTPDTLSPKKINNCVPIPFPWSLRIFPNPTNGRFTVRATLSYSDNRVQLELRTINGGLISVLMPPRTVHAGTFDHVCDISNLASGTYIVTLRGSGGAASEQVVLVK